MRVEWDDDLHRYQPRVMEFGNWRVGRYVAARVTAWGAWACCFVPFFVTGRVLLGVSPAQAFLWSGVFAAGAAYLLANWLTPETPARGWFQLVTDEYRAWSAVVSHRHPTTARVSLTRVKRSPR